MLHSKKLQNITAAFSIAAVGLCHHYDIGTRPNTLGLILGLTSLYTIVLSSLRQDCPSEAAIEHSRKIANVFSGLTVAASLVTLYYLLNKTHSLEDIIKGLVTSGVFSVHAHYFTRHALCDTDSGCSR